MMDSYVKENLAKVARTIRQISFEAIQKANSGHPGLPMGCAELGAYLYGHHLKHFPKNPHWMNRDRFILSAGHGSMLLYACLFLSGFDLSLEDLQQFRQLHSQTPGHPEYGHTPGVEATTGPLGQGVGNAVGQALGLKILAEKFDESYSLFNAKVYCLAGDGCMMEGVSHEASGLAGHLGLDNLILLHDANRVTLDGPLEESSSEDVAARYRAYGFETFEVDGYDFDSMDRIFSSLRESQERPVYIAVKTVIGKGSPHKEGTYQAHGAPLGIEEVRATKKALHLPEQEFFIPRSVVTFFAKRLEEQRKEESYWHRRFDEWKAKHPKWADELEVMMHKRLPKNLEELVQNISFPRMISTRKASQMILKVLGSRLPFLLGGSADLSSSDCTAMQDFSVLSSGHFTGRNIKYGIREFGMATIAAGLWQTGAFLPFVGSFLTFSDYMCNGIRIASLSNYHLIYQFSHDSIFLGEDGPTHQPIEQFATLRAIPHLWVFRPADANEVKDSWLAMLRHKGPSVLILSRQNLLTLTEQGTGRAYAEGVGRGGYIIHRERKGTPDFTLFATGSELALALDVAKALEDRDKQVRVVSLPCWELFESQEKAYKESIVGGSLGQRVSIEAGVSFGWSRFVGRKGISIAIDRFGCSAPPRDLAHEFGFTVDAILNQLLGHG